MNKINCNANNCSHNSNGVCYANRINVGGQGAKEGLSFYLIQIGRASCRERV